MLFSYYNGQIYIMQLFDMSTSSKLSRYCKKLMLYKPQEFKSTLNKFVRYQSGVTSIKLQRSFNSFKLVSDLSVSNFSKQQKLKSNEISLAMPCNALISINQLFDRFNSFKFRRIFIISTFFNPQVFNDSLVIENAICESGVISTPMNPNKLNYYNLGNCTKFHSI
ncbi:Hypothetical_protein [Hexamita inflata]|uniref:Hypothetical_protein n=1 Tax=Hexamita inflata TaxID=28002 RepID=A0AA86R5V7_9EUKA|nr:Hypothetical protein HINF_LOCUS54202 [Hexamita inflata]CAI9966559.1 Hypothetical protein HINF_LOCUS54204 [Hexamita inflata]